VVERGLGGLMSKGEGRREDLVGAGATACSDWTLRRRGPRTRNGRSVSRMSATQPSSRRSGRGRRAGPVWTDDLLAKRRRADERPAGEATEPTFALQLLKGSLVPSSPQSRCQLSLTRRAPASSAVVPPRCQLSLTVTGVVTFNDICHFSAIVVTGAPRRADAMPREDRGSRR
jgi:hypothetical protein